MDVTEEKLYEILENVDRLKFDRGVCEIRMLRTKQGTVSGYFDDYIELVNSIEPYMGINDVYITLNPVKPDLLARCSNRLGGYAKHTTADCDIARLKYILIDLDPIRPAGISATDKEKSEAFHLMKKIEKDLLTKGFPEPILADSGNGYHILFAIDLENNKDNVALLKGFLATLDFLYSNEKVEVDKTTYNPSRIVKLYGTTACKGDDTVDRPHRESSVIKFPEQMMQVTVEQIQEVIKEKPGPVKCNPAAQKRDSMAIKATEKTNVRDFIKKHDLDLAETKPYEDGEMFILSTCPWDPNHTDKSAFIIQFGSGAISAKCHHNSCSKENWPSLKEKVGEASGSTTLDADKNMSQADTLVKMAQGYDSYVDDFKEAYITPNINGKDSVMKIGSYNFKRHLRNIYYQENNGGVASEALKQAVETLKAQAMFSGRMRKLERRAAYHEGSYYYDLGDEQGAIKLNADHHEVLSSPPAIFKRGNNMREQQMPDFKAEPSVLIDLIKKHFRFKKVSDAILMAVYLVAAFIGNIPHVILVLHGEKGSAKSTSMRMLKAIIDPAAQDLLTMPQSKKDLIITLSQNYFSCFDNLDSLSAEKSDTLCLASTGGAISSRTLYSDDEETILEFKVLVAINGINVVATRPDLLDRAIVVELDRIPKSDRKTEKEIWDDFNKDVPSFLGSILNTLKIAISKREGIELDEVGRMADFTYWGYAIAEAMGLEGEAFVTAYLSNQSSANEEAVESHPVAASVVAFMSENETWSGSVSELLNQLQLTALRKHINTRVKVWPKSPSSLSRRLKEVKSNLEETGITYSIDPTNKFKKITLKNGNDFKVSTPRFKKKIKFEDVGVEALFED